MKKIEELLLNEAKNAKEEIKAKIERINIQKYDILKEIEENKNTLKKIKDDKRSKLKEIQNLINKATTKNLKDSKRKIKESTSKGFDSRIRTYDNKIATLKKNVVEKNKEISTLKIISSKITIHINNIK